MRLTTLPVRPRGRLQLVHASPSPPGFLFELLSPPKGTPPGGVRLLYLFRDEDWQPLLVPGRVATVPEAVRWLMPREARQALAEGRRVWRYGSYYLVEKRRGRANLRSLRGSGVAVRPLPGSEAWELRAPGLPPLFVGFPFRVYPENRLRLPLCIDTCKL